MSITSPPLFPTYYSKEGGRRKGRGGSGRAPKGLLALEEGEERGGEGGGGHCIYTYTKNVGGKWGLKRRNEKKMAGGNASGKFDLYFPPNFLF